MGGRRGLTGQCLNGSQPERCDERRDPPTAVATRRRFLDEHTKDGALVIGTHFGGRTAGRVRPDGDGWRLDVS